MSSTVQVGRVEIVALLDTPLGGPLDMIFPAVPGPAWEPYREIYPRSWDGSQFRHNAQCYLLVTPTERVLVDTGLGPGPHAMLGGATGALLEELGGAGTAPDEVDRVVFTHLHGDHIDWTVRDGAATFEEAGVGEAYCGDPAAATAREGEETVAVLAAIVVEAVAEGLGR